MPMQHAESRELQEESVSAFRRLADEGPAELAAVFAHAAKRSEQHRTIIERFGRFPQRNTALRRTSTQEELEWLAAGGAQLDA